MVDFIVTMVTHGFKLLYLVMLALSYCATGDDPVLGPCEEIILRYGDNYQSYYVETIETALHSFQTSCWRVTSPSRSDGNDAVVVLTFNQRPRGHEVIKDDIITCTDGVVKIIDGNGQSLYNVCSDTSLEFDYVYSISDVMNIMFVTSVNDSISMSAWGGLYKDVPSEYYKQFGIRSDSLEIWQIFLIIFLLVLFLLVVFGIVFWCVTQKNKIGEEDEDPFGPTGTKRGRRRANTPTSPGRVTASGVYLDPEPGHRPHGHLPPIRDKHEDRSANHRGRGHRHAHHGSQSGKKFRDRDPYTVKVPSSNISTIDTQEKKHSEQNSEHT